MSSSSGTGEAVLSEEDIQELRGIFSLVDTDGSGSISREEFHQLAKSVGLQLTKDEINQVISEVDKDGSGSIDFEEFCSTMAREINPFGFSCEAVEGFFQSFARRGTPPGLIRVTDLQNAIVTYMHGKVDPLEVHEVLQHYRDSLVNLIPYGSTGSTKESFFNYKEYVEVMRTRKKGSVEIGKELNQSEGVEKDTNNEGKETS